MILLVNANLEARLVVQAVRVNTLSKLTFADSKRFDALVRDIYPGVDFKGVEYAELADALRAAAQESNLMVMETQVRGRWELVVVTIVEGVSDDLPLNVAACIIVIHVDSSAPFDSKN